MGHERLVGMRNRYSGLISEDPGRRSSQVEWKDICQGLDGGCLKIAQ